MKKMMIVLGMALMFSGCLTTSVSESKSCCGSCQMKCDAKKSCCGSCGGKEKAEKSCCGSCGGGKHSH